GVLLLARRRLGHVGPEIDGADHADDYRDPRLLPGEDHARAAAHRHPGDADARQVHVGPCGQRVDDPGDVAGRVRDGRLMDPDGVIRAEPAEALALGKYAWDLALAVQVGVDRDHKQALAGPFAHALGILLLAAAQSVQEDYHRHRLGAFFVIHVGRP